MSDKGNEFLILERDKLGKFRDLLASNTLVHSMSDIFRALSDPTRLRILMALESGELCVCDIAGLMDLSQPSVSHHLKALRQAGIIEFRKSGKMAFYSLKNTRISGLLAVARDFSRNHV